ncbi:hypothetical protein IMQ20_24495 (plasmid) [Escherichia coli]|nr:hypothetical protein [Escherichia coli]EFJ2156417.1 hypothetical protein [Escherichia coli]EFM1297103.1 hypothetical protein [Escherichia coli]EFM1907048.1 hypothetical protein [Escherichia coli]EFM1985037.1 hypothetical protein [Escherichia coli]
MSIPFLKIRFLAKLKFSYVGDVSAFAKDFFTSCLELQQGFQHAVLMQLCCDFFLGGAFLLREV